MSRILNSGTWALWLYFYGQDNAKTACDDPFFSEFLSSIRRQSGMIFFRLPFAFIPRVLKNAVND